MGKFFGGGGFAGGAGAGMAPGMGGFASGFRPQPNFANPMVMAPGMPAVGPNMMMPRGVPVMPPSVGGNMAGMAGVGMPGLGQAPFMPPQAPPMAPPPPQMSAPGGLGQTEFPVLPPGATGNVSNAPPRIPAMPPGMTMAQGPNAPTVPAPQPHQPWYGATKPFSPPPPRGQLGQQQLPVPGVSMTQAPAGANPVTDIPAYPNNRGVTHPGNFAQGGLPAPGQIITPPVRNPQRGNPFMASGTPPMPDANPMRMAGPPPMPTRNPQRMAPPPPTPNPYRTPGQIPNVPVPPTANVNAQAMPMFNPQMPVTGALGHQPRPAPLPPMPTPSPVRAPGAPYRGTPTENARLAEIGKTPEQAPWGSPQATTGQFPMIPGSGAALRGYDVSWGKMEPDFQKALMGARADVLAATAAGKLPPATADFALFSGYRDPKEANINAQYRAWEKRPWPKKPMADPRNSNHGRGTAADLHGLPRDAASRKILKDIFAKHGLHATLRSESWGDDHVHVSFTGR